MKTRRLAVTIMILLSTLLIAGAQNTASQETRKAALEKEIAQLERQIKENSSKSANALNELTLTQKKVSTRKKLIAESNREIAQINDSLTLTRRAANILQTRIDTLSVYYQKLVLNAYKNRDSKVWFIYLLSSEDLGQAIRRYVYFRDLSVQMNTQANKIKDMQADLAEKLKTLEALKSKAISLRAAQQKELDKLTVDERRSKDLVASLDRNKKTYQKNLAAKKKQVKNLNDQIAKIINEYMEERLASSKKSSGGKATTTTKPIDYKLSDQFASNRGKLPWPADGPVVEQFGIHKNPAYSNLEMPFNNGINIGLSKKAAVYAVFNGVVRSIIVMPGYNQCILIQHGKFFTFYCKMGQVDVKAGTQVKTGQKLGNVDTIDGQTQLHFQVWREKNPENPEYWLRPRL